MQAIIAALLAAGALSLSLCSAAAQAQTQPEPRPQAEKVRFDSADRPGGKALSLSAIWVRAAAVNGQTRKPTIVAMHSCGGLYSLIRRDKSLMTPRNVAMVRELRNAGYNVLLPDSLTPRGMNSICTESLQQRELSAVVQARDIQGALRWVARQDEADPARIVLLGWGHGGSAVMKALTAAPERGMPQPRAAIAFYPDCTQFAKPHAAYKPAAPLLMLMGEEDDWAPVAPCAALAGKSGKDAQMLKLIAYPDSYHEFDAPGLQVLVRLDVPNRQHPGQGVTLGSNTETRALAYRDMFTFLDEELR
jgi:dienelactone hydrolase